MKNILKKLLFVQLCILLVACFVGCSLLNLGGKLVVDLSQAQTTIEQGETFDDTKVKVYLNKLGQTTLLDNSNVVFGEINYDKIGQQRISVKYGDLVAFFTLTITPKIDRVLNLVSNTLPRETEKGVQIDFSVVRASIQVDGNTVGFMGDQLLFEGFDKDTEGVQTIKVSVTYQNKTYSATFNVTVYSNVKELRVDLSNLKPVYQYFEFDWSSISVGFYNKGTLEPLTYEQYTHTQVDVMTAGVQTVTVTYGEYQTTFDVQVLPSTAYLTVDLTGVSQTVGVGDQPDLTGLKVTFFIAVGEDGVQIDLNDDQLKLSQIDTSTLGKKTITVTYMERFYTTFEITVVDKFVVSFKYIKDGQLTVVDLTIEQNAIVQPVENIQTTDDLYFLGWYVGDTEQLFDFDTPITKNTVIKAKYLTKTEYINKITQQMQTEFKTALQTKYGTTDYTLIYLTDDYQNSFVQLFDKTNADLTTDKTWQELDEILTDYKTQLNKAISKTLTAIERVNEYKNSLDLTKLSNQSKIEVERLFASVLDQMTDYEGGAPNLDYMFYQLQLQVDFYFA